MKSIPAGEYVLAVTLQVQQNGLPEVLRQVRLGATSPVGATLTTITETE